MLNFSISHFKKNFGHPKHTNDGEKLTKGHYYFSHFMSMASQQISLSPIKLKSFHSYPDLDHHASLSQGRRCRPLNSSNVFQQQISRIIILFALQNVVR